MVSTPSETPPALKIDESMVTPQSESPTSRLILWPVDHVSTNHFRLENDSSESTICKLDSSDEDGLSLGVR